MGRLEVALDTELELRDYAEWPPILKLQSIASDTSPLVIEFEGRRLVWHPGDGEHLPVVSVVTDDPDDWEDEMLLVSRFLSAMAYEFGTSIRIYTTGGAGFKKELDPPLLMQPHMKPTIFPAPARVDRSSDDGELSLALAHIREGLSSASPAHSYISYWKAAEVALGADRFAARLGEMAAEHAAKSERQSEADYFARLNDTRNAAAHAVRQDPNALRHDPDHPQPIARFRTDGYVVYELARRAIEERWPRPVTTSPRR
jgi:hypothetical protein